MAVGDTITAARYNIIRARIAGILGVGAGDEGYGQAVSSTSVAVGATVTAAQMSTLNDDMIKCRVHQTGSSPTEIVTPVTGNTIEDSNPTTKKGYVEFENLSLTCQTSRLNASAGNLSLQSGTESIRSSSWSSDIDHIVTVTFGGYSVTNGDGSTVSVSSNDHMRVFFNAGGTILFSGTIGSGNTAINNDWRNLMTSVGTVAFGSCLLYTSDAADE